MKEERNPSTHLMILYHFACKVLEAHNYQLIEQVDRDFLFKNTEDSTGITMRYSYDYMTIHGGPMPPEIAKRLLEYNIFTHPNSAYATIEANLEKPLDSLWSAVSEHFSDEEVLEIFAQNYGRRRYLEELRQRRRKIDQDFFDPPEDLKSSPFI